MNKEEIEELADAIASKIVERLKEEASDKSPPEQVEESEELEESEEELPVSEITTTTVRKRSGKEPPAKWAEPYIDRLATESKEEYLKLQQQLLDASKLPNSPLPKNLTVKAIQIQRSRCRGALDRSHRLRIEAAEKELELEKAKAAWAELQGNKVET